MTQEPTWRQVNVQKAIATNILRKRRRWAQELRDAGWTVTEPTDEAKGGDEVTTRSDNA